MVEKNKIIISQREKQEDLFKVLNKLNDLLKTMSRIEEEVTQIWRGTIEEMSIKEKHLILFKFEEQFANMENKEMVAEWLRENL